MSWASCLRVGGLVCGWYTFGYMGGVDERVEERACAPMPSLVERVGVLNWVSYCECGWKSTACGNEAQARDMWQSHWVGLVPVGEVGW